MVYRLSLLACLASVSLIASTARSQEVSLDSLRAEQQSILGELEINLTLFEANEMKAQQLTVRVEAHNANADALNAEVQQSNAYCQGQYEEPEYSRRVAQCSTWQAGLNARGRDIDNEQQALQRQREDLLASEQTRSTAEIALLETLSASVGRTVEICSTMSAQARAVACGGPAPVGPRTGPLFAELQLLFNTLTTQCAGLSLDREVECNRQLFDGSRYVPGRPETPTPFN